MSFHVRDDFRAGVPASSVPASWFNSVGKFMNNLVGGLGIRILRDGNPPQVLLDADTAKKVLAIPSVCPNAVVQHDGTGDTEAQVAARAPKDVKQVEMDAQGSAVDETANAKIARIGTSSFVARADHTHRDPVIHSSRPDLSRMLTVSPDNGAVTLSFFPPQFDAGGRFTGLATTAAWSVALLEDV